VTSERRRLGEYEVLELLSSGGMGEVLLARKRGAGGFERLAAIKTIRSDLRNLGQLRAMFQDEARLLSRLTHPAVAQVYDFGESDGTLFLVMEYVAGVNFRDLRELGVAPGVICRAMAQACRGLHAAHELKDEGGAPLGVVHRDVSPDNLMLTYDGEVKVLDFGIALMRGRQAPVTDYGTVKGKPPYLSPEQVRGNAVDRRSDVFSASVVLWELLCGEVLFAGDSIYSIGRDVLEKEIPRPSQRVGPLPAGLDEVVMRGLAREPDQRFQTALALAEALDAVAAGASAESLAVFVASELATAKEQHRVWLARIRGGEVAEPVGRATGMMTAVGEPLPEELEEHQAGRPDAEQPETGISETERYAPPWIPILAGIAVVAALALALLFFLHRGAQAHAIDAAGATLPDAKAIDAQAAIPSSSPIDAGLPPSDAAVVVAVRDAGPRVRRRRPDAAPTVARTPDAGAVAKPGNASIDLASKPFANVRVDGKDVGTTPIFGFRLPAGRHVVEFISPDTGTVVLRRELEVGAGKRYRIVHP